MKEQPEKTLKIKEFLKQVPLFTDLEDEEIDLIYQVSRIVHYPPDTLILSEDEPGNRLYVILTGRVKIALWGEEGQEIILSVLKQGEFFGEMSLLDEEPRSANVVTLEDTETISIQRKDFTAQMKKHPGILLKVARELCRRLRNADKKIGDLAFLQVYGRVAQLLMQLASSQGIVTKYGILIPNMPTHREIAANLGSSREAVSRVLSDMKKRGQISTSGRQLILHEKLMDTLD
ncbi:MAG TPA: Crp/Fnr family transcriptional regulator [Candidatus Limnocylindrales bacterium]|nr:Crp/Fnr family transcriptional regulator [Candidatus Limnocylindrales bacterium]